MTVQSGAKNSKKIKVLSAKEYNCAKIHLAIEYCPTINPCQNCGWPKIDGYICTYCKDR